jgi:hypothetical protein
MERKWNVPNSNLLVWFGMNSHKVRIINRFVRTNSRFVKSWTNYVTTHCLRNELMLNTTRNWYHNLIFINQKIYKFCKLLQQHLFHNKDEKDENYITRPKRYPCWDEWMTMSSSPYASIFHSFCLSMIPYWKWLLLWRRKLMNYGINNIQLYFTYVLGGNEFSCNTSSCKWNAYEIMCSWNS